MTATHEPRTAAVVEFSCPLPPRECSPNSRAHWRKKHEKAATYREEVFLAMHAADAVPWTPWKGPILITLVQYATHLRDHDNFYASFKAGQDEVVWRITGSDDDSPAVVSVVLKAERVRKKADERVSITVTEVQE